MKVFENFKQIFVKEYQVVVNQYNEIRDQLYSMEKKQILYRN